MRWIRENPDVMLGVVVGAIAVIAFVVLEIDGRGLWIHHLAAIISAPIVSFIARSLEKASLLRFFVKVSEGLLAPAARRAGQNAEGRAREAALSVTYLNQVQERTAQSRTFLLVAAAGLLILTYGFDIAAMSNAIFVPLGLYFLLLLKEVVLHYRITHGLFGANAYEARAMIDFLLENADKTDFTDGTGKLKPVFLPEKLREDPLGGAGEVGVRT